MEVSFFFFLLNILFSFHCTYKSLFVWSFIYMCMYKVKEKIKIKKMDGDGDGDGREKTTEPFVWVEDYTETETGGFVWNRQSQQQTPFPRKRKKMEFVGWGSKPLIYFLKSIGRDTTNPISQFDVTAIVNDYVDRNLLHPTTPITFNNHYSLLNVVKVKEKKSKKSKKRILCDDRLRALFGKKSISRVMIYKFLEPHLAAANEQDDSDQDDYLSWCNEEDEEGAAAAHESIGKHETPPYPISKTFAVDDTSNPTLVPKSCFAAVIPENIKLVYLKKSVIQNILKQEDDPKTLKTKIVGSFVRTKSDPNDYRQKHSHNLLLVTGLKVSSGTDGNNAEVLLQVSGLIKDIPISLLSDEDFSKEECEDLHQRVKDGVLKRPKVEELQHKAHILHEDITKHWLARELALLHNLIDRANEKGWRRELCEYLERKELLQTPDEQSRLLRELPEIIAEEIEVEATPQCLPNEIKQRNNDSPGSIMERPVQARLSDTSDDEFALTWASDIEESECGVSVQERQKEPTKSINENRADSTTRKENVTENKPLQGIMEQQVIDLSDDEEIEEPAPAKKEQLISDDKLERPMWHYLDPQGDVQGPFAITLLKHWSDGDYFPTDFRIWRTGQSSSEAVYLKDILNQDFPN